MAEEKYTLVYTGENVDEKLGASDWVVAQGTSGGWHYKKFNSGDCVLWGTFSETPQSSVAIGDLFYSDPVTEISVPFPVNNAVIVGTAANLCYVANVGYNNAAANPFVSYRLVRPVAIPTDSAVTVKLVVWGTWK